jgi:plastocyanin
VGWRSGLLIVILVFGILFSMIYFTNTTTTTLQQPNEVAIVKILDGASNPDNRKFLDPQVVTVVIGVNNTVRWVSEDSTPHTFTTDDGYKDAYSGLFDTRERPQDQGGPFIMPGETFEFTFTRPGEYGYHGEPHPWIHGTVIVLPG